MKKGDRIDDARGFADCTVVKDKVGDLWVKRKETWVCVGPPGPLTLSEIDDHSNLGYETDSILDSNWAPFHYVGVWSPETGEITNEMIPELEPPKTVLVAEPQRIAELRQGDVYKRITTKSQYGGEGEPRMLLGVIQEVLHNGTEPVATAVEWEDHYSTQVVAKLQVFKGEPEGIYPATPEEAITGLIRLLDVQKRAVDMKQRELDDALRLHDRICVLVDLQASLTAPATTPTGGQA